ncbi:RHS repeat-associated core domain-containing protein [Pseudomonas sp. NPDC089408]|uniref:RHS repeat-associated core domain-containing protein n=1 Tax=Pseudomonas sp. NPDC089408 TaxID=3364465 RepID=UPI003813D375
MATTGDNALRHFYQIDHLTTLLGGQALSLLGGDQHLLAQLRCTADVTKSVLLACEEGRSVLGVSLTDRRAEFAYLPYGFHNQQPDLPDLPAYRGALPDRLLPGYSLGAGYRTFNTRLMRFQSADSMSPFGAGGINAYVYTLGDPVNLFDPSAHMPQKVRYPRTKNKPEAKKPAKAPQNKGNTSKNQLAQPEAGSRPAGAVKQQWTLSEESADINDRITSSAKARYESFATLIRDEGMHPKAAAEQVGGMAYSIYKNHSPHRHVLRLSNTERAIFTLEETVVKMRSVGGHALRGA